MRKKKTEGRDKKTGRKERKKDDDKEGERERETYT